MTKADRRRAEIARAAALLFERHGFQNVSVGDLADAVSLSKATLYHYVQSKAEIVAWIHDELMDGLLERLERNVAEREDPRVALKQVLVDTLRSVQEQPGYLKVYLEYQREIPDELRVQAKSRRRRFEELVVSLVERGIADGILRGPDPRPTALALLAITNWSHQWYRPEEGTPEEAADRMFALLLNGAAVEREAVLPMPQPAPEPEQATDGISDATWAQVQAFLPPENGRRGGQWRSHREVLDAIAWKFRSGLAWSELPRSYGSWHTVYGRYVRWQQDGTWARLVDLARTPGSAAVDLAWLSAGTAVE